MPLLTLLGQKAVEVTIGGISQLEAFTSSGGIQVPSDAEVPATGGGCVPFFRRGKPERFGKVLSFEGLFFRVQEEPVAIEESSAGMQIEINRFQGVIDTLDSQMEVIDQEIELFRDRADLIQVKLLEDEAEQVKLFTADLLLQILQLRGIKRRRVEEEELLVILMLN